MKEIRIGTRNSKLAIYQAELVAESLQQSGFQTKLVPIETKGDKILDVSLHKIGSKGVFTEELEHMLRQKEVDIAVHSAKDLPSRMPGDLSLIAFGEREKACDVLVSLEAGISLEGKAMIIGTSSTRRVAMLKRLFPQHQIVDMRGNLLTRLEKLKSGTCHAMILAFAGVHRLGLGQHICQQIPTDVFVPAVGQGSIAIQALKANAELAKAVEQSFHHKPTGIEIETERAFLATMDGGCSVPVFGHAKLQNNQLSVSGGIVSLDGSRFVKKTVSTMLSLKRTNNLEKCIETGTMLARMVLNDGGQEILTEIKSQLNNN